jgi:hypothetical protein
MRMFTPPFAVLANPATLTKSDTDGEVGNNPELSLSTCSTSGIADGLASEK